MQKVSTNIVFEVTPLELQVLRETYQTASLIAQVNGLTAKSPTAARLYGEEARFSHSFLKALNEFSQCFEPGKKTTIELPNGIAHKVVEEVRERALLMKSEYEEREWLTEASQFYLDLWNNAANTARALERFLLF